MARATAAQRGYGARWQRIRRRYLRSNPACLLCQNVAQVPDHWPRSRKELVAAGVANPDADEYLRPLCIACHNRETAINQPGGWATKGSRRRASDPHPGSVEAPGGDPLP